MTKSNLYQMRTFFLTHENIFQTPSGKSAKALPASRKSQTPSAESSDAQIVQTPSGKSPALPEALNLQAVAARFPLPWSPYVRLLSVKDEAGRRFYEEEALLGRRGLGGLDSSPAGGYISTEICSPLDQPKGLRRGFAFRGLRCR